MNTTIDNHEKKDTVHSAEGVVQENVSAVNSAKTRELYNKRQQIYPKNISGTFRKLKWAVLTVLLGIYYILPFLRWPREGSGSDQFVLADFEHRRFYFGPIEIWPQEVYYITGLLILAGVGLFLATSLFGRVWCGYACPQTVWTDLFIWVEQLFEGDRNQRIRLDKAPWSFDKAWRKIGKHTVWLIISLMTGGWFVMYFNDAYEVLGGFLTGKAPFSAYVFAGSLTFTTYALAGTLREQVCTFMCPWPRIQAAMLDHEALSVTYKHDRGEPRGPHKKGQSWEGRGDCVDCRQCIAVCPAGIDIREGLQIECINCALCIDACDEIMDKTHRPRGLIRYASENGIELNQPLRYTSRMKLYTILLIVLTGILATMLITRKYVDATVMRTAGMLYQEVGKDSLSNLYNIKMVNKSNKNINLTLKLEYLPGTLTVPGNGTIPLPKEGQGSGSFFITLPKSVVKDRKTELEIGLYDGDKKIDTQSSNFLGPINTN